MTPENTIRTYSDMVYRIAFARAGTKEDADDIYQEVFLRYIRRKPEFSWFSPCHFLTSPLLYSNLKP